VADVERAMGVFRLLSSRANLELVFLLAALGGVHPREAARLLGWDETVASRRLRRLEAAGVVEAEWARRGGRSVRVYRLRGGFLCGLVPGAAGAPSWGGAGLPGPPRPGALVGREEVLSGLGGGRGGGLVFLAGVPGVGKTALLASLAWLEERRRPVVWYVFSGVEDEERLVRVAAASLGPPRSARSGGLAGLLEDAGASLFLDDLHRVRDRRLLGLLAGLGERGVRVFAAGHVAPRGLGSGARLVVLRGLPAGAAAELLRLHGVEPPGGAMGELLGATGGLPALLLLYARLARVAGQRAALEALRGAAGEEARRALWGSLLEALPGCEGEIASLLAAREAAVPVEELRRATGCRWPRRALEALAASGVAEAGGGSAWLAREAAAIAPRAGVGAVEVGGGGGGRKECRGGV